MHASIVIHSSYSVMTFFILTMLHASMPPSFPPSLPLSIYPSNHPSIRSSIRSSICSSLRSSIRTSIRTFFHSSIHLHNDSLTRNTGVPAARPLLVDLVPLSTPTC